MSQQFLSSQKLFSQRAAEVSAGGAHQGVPNHPLGREQRVVSQQTNKRRRTPNLIPEKNTHSTSKHLNEKMKEVFNLHQREVAPRSLLPKKLPCISDQLSPQSTAKPLPQHHQAPAFGSPGRILKSKKESLEKKSRTGRATGIASSSVENHKEQVPAAFVRTAPTQQHVRSISQPR